MSSAPALTGRHSRSVAQTLATWRIMVSLPGFGGRRSRGRLRLGRAFWRDLRHLALHCRALLERGRRAALLVALAVNLRDLAFAGGERLRALGRERVLRQVLEHAITMTAIDRHRRNVVVTR